MFALSVIFPRSSHIRQDKITNKIPADIAIKIPYYKTLKDWPREGSRSVKDFINVQYQDSLATPSKEIAEKVSRKDQSKFQQQKIPLEITNCKNVLVPSETILIVVQSAPSNFKSREEVRSTWGKTCNEEFPWCAFAFSLGTTR